MPNDARRAGLTLAVSGLAVLAVFLDTTVLFVAFPDIAATWPDVDASALSWVLNGYTIVFAALLVPFGRLADRRGHKSLFLAGSIAFTLASLLCAIAPSPWLLVAARVLQAGGGAALIPASLALVLRASPPERIPVALAIWGAMGAVAGAVGPTLGAAVVESVGWRWVFVLNLPIGILTVVAGRRVLVESRDPSTPLPAPVGVALIIAASGLVALGLVQSGEWGWADPRTVTAIVAGFVLLAAFVAHQRRTSAPAIDLALFDIGNYRWGNVATFAFGIVFSAMFLSSILFLTEVWGYSILRAGFAVAPGPALVAVLAPRMGHLAGRIGQRPLLVVGGLVFAAGGAFRLTQLGGDPAYVADYLPSMLLTGVGVALCLPQLSSVIGQALPPNRLGVGGAANQAVRQFGGTFGVALAVGFVGTPAGLADALDRFDRVWWLLVVGALATSLASLPLRTGAVRRAVVAPTPAAATAVEATAPSVGVEATAPSVGVEATAPSVGVEASAVGASAVEAEVG
jgi:EmrB/QacA subfamily drug resistance transporter